MKRFTDKVKIDVSGCWIWTGAEKGKGYGYFWHNNKGNKAHRVSYELYVGGIPDGLFVCHKCDVRKCVNPDHLFLGTHQDNMADMQSKKPPLPPPTPMEEMYKGQKKLTINDVLKIKDLLIEGSTPFTQIAKMYGISRRAIYDIRKGHTWAWVK